MNHIICRRENGEHQNSNFIKFHHSVIASEKDTSIKILSNIQYLYIREPRKDLMEIFKYYLEQ